MFKEPRARLAAPGRRGRDGLRRPNRLARIAGRIGSSAEFRRNGSRRRLIGVSSRKRGAGGVRASAFMATCRVADGRSMSGAGRNARQESNASARPFVIGRRGRVRLRRRTRLARIAGRIGSSAEFRRNGSRRRLCGVSSRKRGAGGVRAAAFMATSGVVDERSMSGAGRYARQECNAPARPLVPGRRDRDRLRRRTRLALILGADRVFGEIPPKEFMPSARRNRFAHAWRMTGARQARRAHGDGSGRGREALCPAEQMRGEGGSPSARAVPRIGPEVEFSPADDPGSSRIPPFRHHCLSRARSLDGYKGAVVRRSAFEGFRGFMPDP